MKKVLKKPKPVIDTIMHVIIPDTQCKPGVPLEHLEWAGKHIARKKPNVVVVMGDWWDMPSLSSYDAGKKSFEGRMYKEDIAAGHRGMKLFLDPIRKMKTKKPRMIFLMGNHEERILRAVESDRKLEGTIGYHDLKLEEYGFEVYQFLEVVRVDGIAYSHFFPRAASGSVMQTRQGAPNAKAQLQREGGSCTSGHRQGLDSCPLPLGGKLQWGIIAGSFYQHTENYLSPQGNDHWRGIVIKYDVKEGSFTPVFANMDYLRRRYGKTSK